MKKLTLFVIGLFILMNSCNNNSSELNNLLTDKTWITENKGQYYFSSNDSREYIWMSFERREGNTYTPFIIAEGTPETNPLPKDKWTRKGWRKSQYFKIVKDTLIFQDEYDINGEDLTKFHVEMGNDTVIGIVNYKTLRVTNNYGVRIWKTKE